MMWKRGLTKLRSRHQQERAFQDSPVGVCPWLAIDSGSLMLIYDWLTPRESGTLVHQFEKTGIGLPLKSNFFTIQIFPYILYYFNP